MTPEQAAAAGARAEAAMEVIDPALETVRQAILTELIRTSDEAKILKLHSAAQTVDAVRSAIEQVISNGQLERFTLD